MIASGVLPSYSSNVDVLHSDISFDISRSEGQVTCFPVTVQ